MSTVCSKCNQAYLETHVCTVEPNQSFEEMVYGLFPTAFGALHPTDLSKAEAALAAHQSELDLAVKEARLEAFKEVLGVCNDNDLADRKWSRGDFIKYMKYELGWNDRSGTPVNDAFPDTKEQL